MCLWVEELYHARLRRRAFAHRVFAGRFITRRSCFGRTECWRHCFQVTVPPGDSSPGCGIAQSLYRVGAGTVRLGQGLHPSPGHSSGPSTAHTAAWGRDGCQQPAQDCSAGEGWHWARTQAGEVRAHRGEAWISALALGVRRRGVCKLEVRISEWGLHSSEL